MKRSLALWLVLVLLLPACVPAGSRIAAPAPDEAAQLEAARTAIALTQTAPAVMPTPQPTETSLVPNPIAPAAGLKPADSDTPAAGICAEAASAVARIVLGAGPDGLPLAGRCWVLPPAVRIRLVNGSDAPLVFDFAHYRVDLAAGEEMLLDLPVGEFLAPGVHFLPNGPEIWLK